MIALNDAIADGRDVSWIWDVDFEPLLESLERLVVTGERAAELAVRCKYGGLDASAIEVVPDLERALDRGLELTPPGGVLTVLPTYTAMLALRRVARASWQRAAVLGARRMRDPDRPPLSRLPEHLRRSREHRGLRAPRGGPRPRARGERHRARRAGQPRGARPLLRRRRPGPRAGPDRGRPGREGRERFARRSPVAPRHSPSAAATSSSAGSTATATAATYRAPACSRWRPTRASGG